MADKHIFNWTLEPIIHQSPPRTDHLTRSSKDSDESMITHSCREIEAQAQRSEGTTEDTLHIVPQMTSRTRPMNKIGAQNDGVKSFRFMGQDAFRKSTRPTIILGEK